MKNHELPNMGGLTISAKLTVRILEEMKSGIFSNNEKLPSELDLAEQYDVSRSVIRDVMSTLEQEGFVERVRGAGTVINRHILNLRSRLDMKYEYTELIKNTGFDKTTDDISLYLKPADNDLAEKIDVDVGSNIIVCEKRLLAHKKPVIYSINHIPESVFKDVDYKSLNWNLPVFDILEKHCGLIVDTGLTRISATNGTPLIREKLELKEDEALILLDEIGYYKLNYPIMHTYGFYTNFFDFTMLRKKL